MRKRGRRLLSLVLILVCLLLGLAAKALWDYTQGWLGERLLALSEPVARHQSNGAESAIPGMDMEFMPLNFFSEMSQRPLFSSSRRPPPPPEKPPPPEPQAPPPAPPPQPLRAVLTSIIITEQTRVALVRDVGGKTVRLERGASLQEWRVESIEDDQVVFTQGEETQVLKLRDYGNAAVPGTRLRPTRPRRRQ